MPDYLLAIDQGTTSTRAILFDAALAPVAIAQQEFAADLSGARPGRARSRGDLVDARLRPCAPPWPRPARAPKDVAAIGITNQRETTIVWDRATGRPIHNAIVWQDRRTADACAALRQAGHEPAIAARTGLLLDPYFSATKIAWLLDHVAGARAAARAGRLAFGTVDSFLLWRLTGGKVHATDATNASRTLLLDIRRGALGRRACASCSASRWRCCRRCATAPATSATTGAVRRADPHSRASPATSRRRRSGRAALRPA